MIQVGFLNDHEDDYEIYIVKSNLSSETIKIKF